MDSTNPAFDTGPAWQETLAGGWDIDGDGVGEFYTSFDGSGDPAKNYILREFQPTSDGSSFEVSWSVEIDSMTQLSPNQRVIALGDVNGNGVNELLFGVTPIDPNDPNLLVYEVSGNALPTTPTATLITPRPTAEYLATDSSAVRESQLEWSWEGPWVIDDIDNDGQNEFVGTGTGIMVMEFSGDWASPQAPDDVNFEFQMPDAGETYQLGVPGFLPEFFATAMTAADLDGDGRKDITALFPGWRHQPGGENDNNLFKERPLRVFRTTGSNSYSLDAQLTLRTSKDTPNTPAWTGFTPQGWFGANRGVVAVDLDNDGRDEIFHTSPGGFGVGGSLWLIDLSGTIASLDSNDIHLLVEFNDFLPEGTNSATHGMAAADMDGDGNTEFYIADLDARRVWQVAYLGGDITNPGSYATKEVMRFPDGTQPKTLIGGQDMDNDGRPELVIQGPPGATGANILILERSLPTSVGDTPGNVPVVFDLAQNYPNPFNPETSIRYSIPKDADVKLTVFNMLGQRAAVLVNTQQASGTHLVRWNGRNDAGVRVSSGIYVYRLQAGDLLQTKKMLLLK